MTPRRKRILLVLGILAGVAIAATLALQAFRSNVMYYFDPTQVAAGEVKTGKRFQLGGMVEAGSVRRQTGSLEINFVVTDFKHQAAGPLHGRAAGPVQGELRRGCARAPRRQRRVRRRRDGGQAR